jgi:hypothetical protein
MKTANLSKSNALSEIGNQIGNHWTESSFITFKELMSFLDVTCREPKLWRDARTEFNWCYTPKVHGKTTECNLSKHLKLTIHNTAVFNRYAQNIMRYFLFFQVSHLLGDWRSVTVTAARFPSISRRCTSRDRTCSWIYDGQWPTDNTVHSPLQSRTCQGLVTPARYKHASSLQVLHTWVNCA